MTTPTQLRIRPRQDGMAALVVVAVLFFIASMVAAYTNRNLIFEQRTSGNQYRSTQSFEAADAGLEWALSMLNNGRIDANCQPTADVTATSFRERYLQIDDSTGVIAPAPAIDNKGTVWPSCVFDGADWDCSCPANGSPAVAAPAGTGVFPAFRLRFVKETGKPNLPGLVWLEVNGCTRLDDACLDFPASAVAGEARTGVRVLLALKSALPAVPSAAVTVRGQFDVGGAAFGAYNPSTTTSGLAVVAGGSVVNDGSLLVGSAPGTPADPAALISQNDPSLGATRIPAAVPDRMFSNLFSADADVYRDLAATLLLDCSGGCDADTIRTLAARNPGRMIWAEGDVNLDTGGDVGSATQPVLLVVNGDLNVDVTVHGLIYGRPQDWAVSGSAAGVVEGALIAETNLATTGAPISVVHNNDALARMHWAYGSFVRVPGGWKDF